MSSTIATLRVRVPERTPFDINASYIVQSRPLHARQESGWSERYDLNRVRLSAMAVGSAALRNEAK